MKQVKLTLLVALVGILSAPVKAQSLKEKMRAKMEKVKGGGGGSANFEELNSVEDEMGVTGQYWGLSDGNSYGFKFVREADGKVVNEIYYYEKKITPSPLLKLKLKEKYHSKNNVKLFYTWVSNYKEGYVEIIELDKGVFAQVSQSSYSNNDYGSVKPDAKRTVKDVYAKDKANLEVYDIETAQAKVDAIMLSLNTEKIEKERTKMMKNEVFKNNVNKLVFSDNWGYLQKRGYPDVVSVDGKGFKTNLDMSGNMIFMAFFDMPPAVKYPGQQINIVYEMNGVKHSREELRMKSSAWSSMVKILETKDFEYFQSPTRAIREYNSYHSAYVQDYAAMQVLYSNRDRFKVGGKYALTVKVYSHMDGEDGDLLAEGTVDLTYSEKAKIAFEGDPAKPQKKSVWEMFEEFLDE